MSRVIWLNCWCVLFCGLLRWCLWVSVWRIEFELGEWVGGEVWGGGE